jgi:hypothetical protein
MYCYKLWLTFNRSFLIEEKCRFLSNFSLQTAEVELPGEFLLPKVLCPISRASPYLRKPAPTQDRIYKPSTTQTICEI